MSNAPVKIVFLGGLALIAANLVAVIPGLLASRR